MVLKTYAYIRPIDCPVLQLHLHSFGLAFPPVRPKSHLFPGRNHLVLPMGGRISIRAWPESGPNRTSEKVTVALEEPHRVDEVTPSEGRR